MKRGKSLYKRSELIMKDAVRLGLIDQKQRVLHVGMLVTKELIFDDGVARHDARSGGQVDGVIGAFGQAFGHGESAGVADELDGAAHKHI
ncbi:MAG: hypothetical protein ACREGC_01710 [Minisyncoccia bacterium]